ncbi:MAG: LysR family transcriptional regulator, partial [Pseudomonadota bacterium]
MTSTQMQGPLLDLDVLRTLVAIADTGSFSGAAEQVLRTPSAVSMQVKKVEELLGVPVFTRDSRNVALTRDGAFLVEHGRRMMALNRDALSRFVAPDMAGEVRIGAHDDVAERFLPNMLCRFGETHPAVRVQVVVEGTKRLMEMRHAGQLDLAIITCQGVEGTQDAEVLYREQLVWAMRQGGVAPEQTPLPLSVWEDGCAWRNAG